MQAEILGFVGFTQQEKDVLSPREAATITEYLRALLEGASADLTLLTTSLNSHLSDYDDPHKVGQSKSFLESVYQFLYGYYKDITDAPMSYADFKQMATTPIWLDFVRRLITDHNLFVATKGITGDVTLPVGLDTASVDPLASASTATATGITSIDDFLSKRGGLTGWNTFASGNDLTLNSNFLRPRFYIRKELPLLLTSDAFLKDFLSVTDMDLSDDMLPIHVGLRLGAGKAPTAGMADILSFTIDAHTVTLSYDPVAKSLEVKTTLDGFATIGPVDVPTGIVWVGLTADAITITTQQTQSVTDLTTDITTVPLGTPKSMSILQPTATTGNEVNILAMAVFTGVLDADAIQRQTAYL